MNADGSLGVDADVNAGANIPFLDELGWSAIGSGSPVGRPSSGIRRPIATGGAQDAHRHA